MTETLVESRQSSYINQKEPWSKGKKYSRECEAL